MLILYTYRVCRRTRQLRRERERKRERERAGRSVRRVNPKWSPPNQTEAYKMCERALMLIEINDIFENGLNDEMDRLADTRTHTDRLNTLQGTN